MKFKILPMRPAAGLICMTALVLLLTAPFTAHAQTTTADKESTPIRQNELKVDLMFVLDNSGSMIRNDPQFITREVVTDYVKRLRQNFRVGMVVFDQEARLVEPLTAIDAPVAGEKFLKSLDMITYKGQFTNTPSGVERAIYELKTGGREDAQKVIILLTDGIVDTGNKDQDLEGEKWLKENLAMESKKAGIRIFGIAFTDKADFRLMQSLAIQTDGEYFRAYNTDDIQTVFNAIDRILVEPPEPVAVPEPVEPPEPAPVPQEPAMPIELPDTPLAEPEPPAKGTTPIPLLLSGLIVIVIIFVVLVYMRRKKDVIIRADAGRKAPARYPEEELPTTPAELIDANNIITDTSLSLSLPLDKKVIRVGRDAGNDVMIPKNSISSFHATIEFKNGYYYLEDHRSTNGTKLNNKPIRENAPIRLKSGDTIHFADCEFRFLVPDVAPYGETVMIRRDQV